MPLPEAGQASGPAMGNLAPRSHRPGKGEPWHAKGSPSGATRKSLADAAQEARDVLKT
jgi:hypothetical protein